MAIAYQVFENVSNVALGASAVHGVESVRLTKKRLEIRASGDGELYDSVAAVGPCSVSGTIDTLDPVSAAALDGQVGALSFIWKAAGAGTDKTVTITNVSVTGVDIDVGRRGKSLAAVHFTAAGTDGVTDPVAIT